MSACSTRRPPGRCSLTRCAARASTRRSRATSCRGGCAARWWAGSSPSRAGTRRSMKSLRPPGRAARACGMRMRRLADHRAGVSASVARPARRPRAGLGTPDAGGAGHPTAVHGTPPAGGPVLLVANHISWLDILVMHAARHCRFVSKAEFKHWPLIGTLATGARHAVHRARIAPRRHARGAPDGRQPARRRDLAVFPEGTTSDGISLLPFHANLIQAAISAGAGATGGAELHGRGHRRRPAWRPLHRRRHADRLDLAHADHAGHCGRGALRRAAAGQGRDRRAWAADLREAVKGLRASRALKRRSQFARAALLARHAAQLAAWPGRPG
jgi:1-acyl-sn-glycerol-3-phosphate acyltransferase